MGKRKPIAIDLFCGVGGMSLGFKQAGFRVVGAFDKEERHVRAYRKNFPSTPAFCVDLSKETGESLLSLAGCRRKIDLVFGGPPCQGFSMAGKRDLNDERNQLIFDFIRLVREIRPKYFVMENVQGLMLGEAVNLLNSFLHRAHLAGYSTVNKVRALNAADFGVPQRRRRTFVIGYRSDLRSPNYPAPAPIVDESGKSYSPTVRDALGDLPVIEDYDALLTKDGFTGSLGRASHYARIMRGEAKESSDGLRHRKRNGRFLTGCLRTEHSEESVARFSRTGPGDMEPVSRFYRLDYAGVAPTIRAGTGRDHGGYMAPRPIHPEHPRCITVREAARLHSYPDWFDFDPTRWHAFRQIGNSVPPRLARCVALEILKATRHEK
jgi:DNA (cytosine-5)-methyltransferase 1